MATLSSNIAWKIPWTDTLEVNKTTETKPSQIVPKTRSQVKVLTRDCLGDAVDKNPPAKVGDMGSIPSLGRFPGLQSN